MSRFVLIAILCLWVGPTAQGQSLRQLSPTELHGNVQGHVLRLSLHGRKYTVRLDSTVDAAAIDSFRVLDVSKRADTLFVLLTLNGPSRGRGGEMGYCGAGSEGYVLWARLPAGIGSPPTIVRYDSCFHNISDGSWTIGRDSIVGEWFTPAGRIRATYRPAAPGAGIRMVSLPKP